MLVSLLLALQAYVASRRKGNQLVAGIAINIAMSGLTFVVAQYLFQQGGRTPDLGRRVCSTWCCPVLRQWKISPSSAGCMPT
jgi:ABC-type uncharacterized transport system permease subunit